MEGIEGVPLIAADGQAKESLPSATESFAQTRQQRLEILRNDPEVTPIKDQKLLEFTERIQQTLVSNLEKFGLKPNRIQNIFEVSKDFLVKRNGEYGNIILGTMDNNTSSILVWNHNLPGDRLSGEAGVATGEVELSLFKKAIIIGHEIYHNGAPLIWRVRTIDEKTTNIEPWRNGLTHLDGPDGEQYALEEGLAKLWEDDQVEKMAREIFPEGARVNDKYMDLIKKQGFKDYVVKNFDTLHQQVWTVKEHYLDSKKLVNFLIEKVTNFRELVEKARIGDGLGDLAVAVEGVFGLGTFGELMDTKDRGAGQMLEKLQNTVSSKPQTTS